MAWKKTIILTRKLNVNGNISKIVQLVINLLFMNSNSNKDRSIDYNIIIIIVIKIIKYYFFLN